MIKLNGFKKCPDCGKMKPASAFYHNKRTKDKLSYDCRECHLRISRDYYAWQKRARKGEFQKEPFSPVKVFGGEP
jgi:hypothetical protein